MDKERRSLALPDSAFHGVFLCFDLHYFIYCANIVKDKLIKIAFAAGIVSLLLGVGGKALPAGTLGCFAGILALASTKWEDGE